MQHPAKWARSRPAAVQHPVSCSGPPPTGFQSPSVDRSQPRADPISRFLCLRSTRRSGGKYEVAAPAQAHCPTHECGHSGLRFNAPPCCTSHQGQQCAGSGPCKLANRGRLSRRARPIAAIRAVIGCCSAAFTFLPFVHHAAMLGRQVCAEQSAPMSYLSDQNFC